MRQGRNWFAGLSALSLLLSTAALARAQTPEPAQPGQAPSPAPSVPGADVAVAPAVAPESPPAGATPPPTAPPAPAPSEPAPAAVAADAAGSEAAAADAAAAALETELAERATEGDGFKLDVYGFADFTYGIAVQKFEFGSPYNSFAVGNLNVYLAADLGDSWRSMAEIRFSYLPHGANQVDVENPAAPINRIDTTVPDYTDLGRAKRWGGIMIERAYLEYLAHPLLNVRAGHYLTPYGIWNVDHGSPVIIGVRRPFIVGEALLPQSQTGLELYGAHHFDPVRVGYHLTLSNGRGPIDTYQDLNSNKAIGGRLFASADTSAGAFTLGLSGYAGRYTDRGEQWGIDANGDLGITRPITADYDERSFATDLKWEFKGVLVQGEAIMNDVVYDELRPPDTLVLEGPPGYLPDYRRVGIYGLAGYRFDWLGAMPFAGLEYYDGGRPSFGGESAAFWGGLNVRPTARVVLKAQYTYSWFPGDPEGLPENSHYNSVDLQAAWSF